MLWLNIAEVEGNSFPLRHIDKKIERFLEKEQIKAAIPYTNSNEYKTNTLKIESTATVCKCITFPFFYIIHICSTTLLDNSIHAYCSDFYIM